MSDSTSKNQTGGDYGNIRASINVDNLNVYLAKSTPSIKTPVDVKQFKVRAVWEWQESFEWNYSLSSVKYVSRVSTVSP